ncbi:helix-turn-helix domain-containing protein [Brucella sp. IR073]|uniref:helix-turn-helix domain-containing protein n=1 Tax=unclassified Brucella TaxID=2632610 RepID=UPI003B98335D
MSVTFTTPSGDEMVILPRAEYEQLLADAEMAQDIAAYDRAKARIASGEEERIPAEIVNRILDGENPVRVWRDHRGMSAKVLAGAADIAPAYLSQIETGKREGTLDTMRKIAQALNITLDDLVV